MKIDVILILVLINFSFIRFNMRELLSIINLLYLRTNFLQVIPLKKDFNLFKTELIKNYFNLNLKKILAKLGSENKIKFTKIMYYSETTD